MIEIAPHIWVNPIHVIKILVDSQGNTNIYMIDGSAIAVNSAAKDIVEKLKGF